MFAVKRTQSLSTRLSSSQPHSPAQLPQPHPQPQVPQPQPQLQLTTRSSAGSVTSGAATPIAVRELQQQQQQQQHGSPFYVPAAASASAVDGALELASSGSGVSVFCRVAQPEEGDAAPAAVAAVDLHTVSVTRGTDQRSFAFDGVFSPTASAGAQ